MKRLIVGTKFHRRLPSTRYIPDADSESDSDDCDYNPNYAEEDSESEDTDTEMNVVEESTLRNVSVVSTRQSCINVTGSNLLCKQHIVLNHMFFRCESSSRKIRGFQWRSWSATIPHRENIIQAGCD